MGAAAGADVRPRDGDDPHLALDLLFAAVGHPGQFGAGGVDDLDRQVLPDKAVGLGLGLAQPFGTDGDAGVHPHRLAADVKAHVLGPEQPVQRPGQDVFAGVLLHLVEPPGPVDGRLHRRAGDGGGGKALHRVPDHPRLFVDVGDGKARPVRQGEKAAVGGLAAPLGVKDRPGQGDEAPAVRLRQNGRDADVSMS